MPHECTNCGRVFPDGSTEMLSGCPECGGTKFQYHPEGVPENDSAPTETSDAPEPDTEPPEDAAQTRARRTTVDPADLPAAPEPSDSPAEDSQPESSPATDTADEEEFDELRSALNDQFESIKIVSPGEYELNLMELYDRDEHIISLMEDGRYAIDVPGRRSGEQ